MKIQSAFFVSGFVTLSSLLVVLTNCGDDPNQSEPARGARKGEACQTTNDCGAGLACVPAGSGGGGVCVLGVFSVTQTAKECAVTECTAPTDCCGTPPSKCTSLLQQCGALQDAGVQPPVSQCLEYERDCTCDPARRDCENNKCVTKCADNAECSASGAGRICAGGKCVQCGSDSDCTAGGNSELKCVSGSCEPPCQGDGDCPGFERCMAGTCTEGACQTNRECIAATRNVEASCGTDGKCIVPCTTDLECGSPRNFRFFSCVSGQCLYLGCESDKDCRLLLEGTSGTSSSSGSTTSSTSSSGSTSSSSGGFTPERHIVCREKQTPGTSTIPAQ